MSQSPVEIRKLCPELMQDFLLFFDGEAFADNPKWGFCLCQFLYVDHAKVLHIAEAMPMAEASSDAQNHFGPLSMYLAAGFQVHRTDAEGRTYVRLRLV